MAGESDIALIKWVKSGLPYIPEMLLAGLDGAIDTVAGLRVGAREVCAASYDNEAVPVQPAFEVIC